MAQLLNPCAPPPSDPCPLPARYAEMFETGVSFRQVAICGPTYCDCESPSYGRLRINSSGRLDRSDWLRGWIFAQLSGRGEVTDCHVSPTGERAGGWWADSFRAVSGPGAGQFRTGSKLWALQGRVVNNDTLLKAKAYATEALSVLHAWGIISRLRVDVSYISRNVMRLAVSVWGPGEVSTGVTIEGMTQPNGDWVWREYRQQLTPKPLMRRMPNAA